MASAETSSLPCARCQAPAKLQCPNCLKLGLPKDASVFCSQECFKAAWPEHKKVHSPPADAWLYCTKRGKARSDAMPDFDWTGPLRPHRISPRREVPDTIPKPDYFKDGFPYKEQESRQQQIVPIRGPDDTAGIRAACRIGREVLDLAAAAAKPGVTTDELDRIVHEAMIERGAYPSPLNYFNFPKSVCTSINEVICHGIPDARELQDGDILNIDVTAYFQGFHGDLNETICVGNVDEEGKQLIKVPGGQVVLRPRHRRPVPLRPQRAPLRAQQGGGHHEGGTRLHHRAHDQRRLLARPHLAGRLDGGHGRRQAQCAV
ncbi:hypothetical protein PLESTF_001880600 [Pleodorina starrii]|nr:hypothetical protein PLESTF_001880600 [Pleodorina starrii]